MRPRLVFTVAVLALAGGTALAWSQPPDRPPRAFLGILAEPAPAGAERPGVFVRAVTVDSPAARAGLKPGDEIVKVGDKAMSDFDALVNSLARHKPGDKLTFHVRRDGKEQTVPVTLGERPNPLATAAAREIPTAFLGVETQELTPTERARLGVKANAGAVVREVVPGTPAAEAGVKPGDVITSFNGKEVGNPIQLRAAVQQAGAGKEVTLEVARGNETKTLKARLEASPADFFSQLPTLREGPEFQRLQRRVDELERRLRELEAKLNQRAPK